MLSAPARAMSSMCCSGRSTIMWTSSRPPASWTQVGQRRHDHGPERDRRDEVAVHHVDVDHAGARPRAPPRPAIRAARSPRTGSTARSAAGAASTASARAPSSDRGRRPSFRPLDGLEHAAVAVIASHDRGAGHPYDRRVLAAVGAHRHELEPLQAIDAAVPARNRRRPQPWLPTAGALGPEFRLLGCLAHT